MKESQLSSIECLWGKECKADRTVSSWTVSNGT